MKEFSAEYNDAVEAFENTELVREQVEQSCREANAQSLDAWFTVQEIRKKRLLLELDVQGLEVCDEYHAPLSEEGKIRPDELGIFPKDKVHVRYESKFIHLPDGLIDEEERNTKFRTERVDFLCDVHLSGQLDNEWSVSIEDGQPNFRSLVLAEGERYVTRLNRKDVTEIVETKQNSRFFSNGDEPLYRFFNLPELPPQPPQSVHE